MKVLAVIPARGGSKSIRKKNITNLGGKPLIDYTIQAALNSKNINKIVVSTEDQEIKSFSKSRNVEVIDRPYSLANDNTLTLDVIKHLIFDNNFQNKFDLVMTLQPTSPFRKTIHIDESIDLMRENPSADSLVSCIKLPHNYNPQSLMKLDKNGYLYEIKSNNKIYRRQDKDTFYARNGAAIYLTKMSKINDYIFGGKILPYFMDLRYSIDIDEVSDLEFAEVFLKYLNLKSSNEK